MNKGGPRAALFVNDFAQPGLDYITVVPASGRPTSKPISQSAKEQRDAEKNDSS
jgi:hypothetical protein